MKKFVVTLLVLSFFIAFGELDHVKKHSSCSNSSGISDCQNNSADSSHEEQHCFHCFHHLSFALPQTTIVFASITFSFTPLPLIEEDHGFSTHNLYRPPIA